MNITPSQPAVAPSPTASDPAAASRSTPDTDNAGVDPGATPPAFGQVLSDRLAQGARAGDANGAGSDGTAATTRRDGRATTAADGAASDALDVGFGAGQDPSTVGAAAKAPSTGDTADATNDADTATSPAGSDLAAQLALVSQWAALARPATPATHDATAHDTSRDPLDVHGKLDAVRTAATTPAAGTDAVTNADADAALVAASGATLAPSFDPRAVVARSSDRATLRADRATSALGAAASTRSQTAATQDPTTALQTPGTERVSTAFERLFAIAGATTPGQAPDAASLSAAAALAAQPATGRVDVAAAPATSDAAAPSELRETVGTPAWTHEVGQATLRMAANDLTNVSLRLNPEHLGPLDVQMRVDNGVAHLQFAASHADTRQALESSRTTLDQMLGQQGIKLGDWSVGQQPSDPSGGRGFDAPSAQRGSRDGRGRASGGRGQDEPGVATNVVIRSVSGLGLVDTFA